MDVFADWMSNRERKHILKKKREKKKRRKKKDWNVSAPEIIK